MSLAVFAEGTDQEFTDPVRKRNSFMALWRFLLQRAGSEPLVAVKGFSKKAIIRMFGPLRGSSLRTLYLGPEPDDNIDLNASSGIPPELAQQLRVPSLDKLIGETYEETPFDRAVIALDLEPKHNALKEGCRRAEIFMLLECLRHSKYVPQFLRKDARELQLWYRKRPAPRKGQPPKFALEVLIMPPCFEAMMLNDEADLLGAIGLQTRPKEWPVFRVDHPKIDQHVFKPACKLAAPEVHAKLQDRHCADKHAWALHILECVPPESKIWKHDIFVRLQQLVQSSGNAQVA